MANRFDNNETLAFQEEEANLSRVEELIDDLISSAEDRRNRYNDQITNKRYFHIDDKFEYMGAARACENQIYEYNELKQSPYYGRIDVARDDGEVQTFFVGYSPLTLYGKSEILSWKSPLGNTFNQKSKKEFNINGYHYTLYLRRAIDIKHAELQMINTEYDIDSVSLNGEIIDPFLLSVLRDKRRNHVLTDIVRTIQENQNDIISKPIGESFAVQGCAGSGKTMILLHRLAYLAYNHPKSDFSKWCILTPNEYFNVHIQELSETLDIAEIKRFTVEEYYGELMRYLLPVDKSKNNKIDINVQSEKTLCCDMLAEIYSPEFRDRVVSRYNELWENCISILEEKGFDFVLEEFLRLAPSVRFRLPDLSVYKFSTYGMLSSILHTMRSKMMDAISKHKKAEEDIARLQAELSKARMDLNAYEINVNETRKSALLDIADEIRKSEIDISKCRGDVSSLRDEIFDLKSKRSDLQNRVVEQEACLNASVNSSLDMAKYEYVILNDTPLATLLKKECCDEFAEVASLENELRRIPIYNFGKRNKVKSALVNAKNKFTEKAISVINSVKASSTRDIETLKQQIATFDFEISSVKSEIEIHEKKIKQAADKTLALRMCKETIETQSSISAVKLLQDPKLAELRKFYDGYFLSVKKLTETQEKINAQLETLKKLEMVILENEPYVAKRTMLATIEEMKDTLELINYGTIKKELKKLLDQAYKKYSYKRRANENYRHRLYYRLLVASLYYSGNGAIHNFVNIDEAQDIAVTEYDLFKSVLGDVCVFNLYGDVNQLIYDYKGVSEWEDISSIINDRIYLLNENYRNTIQITEYCNNVFGAEVTAIGLQGNDVKECNLSTAISSMLKERVNNNDSRFGIIYKRGVTGFKSTIESMVNPCLISWDVGIFISLAFITPLNNTLIRISCFFVTRKKNGITKVEYIKNQKKKMEITREQIIYFMKNIHREIPSIISNIGFLICNNCLPYFIYLFLSKEQFSLEGLLLYFALYQTVSYVTTFFPVPGNAGVAESTFVLVFKSTMGNIVGACLLIWRLFNYYLMVVVDVIYFNVDTMRKKNNLEKVKEE